MDTAIAATAASSPRTDGTVASRPWLWVRVEGIHHDAIRRVPVEVRSPALERTRRLLRTSHSSSLVESATATKLNADLLAFAEAAAPQAAGSAA